VGKVALLSEIESNPPNPEAPRITPTPPTPAVLRISLREIFFPITEDSSMMF